MIKCTKRNLIIAILLSWSLKVSAIPILDVKNGQLMGASNINVSGELLNVTFAQGSCADVFGGCDEVSNFFFSNRADAEAASTALFDYVLIDSVLGQFDSSPSLVNGCKTADPCHVVTPFGFLPPSKFGLRWEGSSAQNGSSNDFLPGVGGPIGLLSGNISFAVWSSAQVSVPEPGTLALFSLGLLFISKRNKNWLSKLSVIK